MSDELFIHEDNRRILIEWIADQKFCSAKVVVGKAGGVVGDHYHNKKDETFLLLIGHAKRVVIGDKEELNVPALKKWFVPKGTYHLFELDAGAILLGACTKPFDQKDELIRAE